MRGVLCSGCQRYYHLRGCAAAAAAAAGAGLGSRRGQAQVQPLCGRCSSMAGEAPAEQDACKQQQQQQHGAGGSGEKVVGVLKRRRPTWADSRRGVWVLGLGEDDFFVQEGDFAIMHAASATAARDPCAFVVHSRSGAEAAYVTVCRVARITRQALTVTMFANRQRSLSFPLLYKPEVQHVLTSITGLIHVLEPEGAEELVVEQLQLDTAVVARVQQVLFPNC